MQNFATTQSTLILGQL